MKRVRSNGVYQISGQLMLAHWADPAVPIGSSELIVNLDPECMSVMCVEIVADKKDPHVKVVPVPDEAKAFFTDLLDAVFMMREYD